MMQFFYSFGIVLYGWVARLIAPFNSKTKRWVKGQQTVFELIQKFVSQIDRVHSGKIVWFHCASLGEFEQGRPVIEKFKQQHPRHTLVLTFWSPSGYEIRKNYQGVDAVFYLPLDTKRNVRKFLSLLNPDMVFFVKYEFWFNYLQEIQHRKIPLYLFSAIFRHNQHFFKRHGSWTRDILKQFTKIFVQNEASKQLLESIGVVNVIVSGDTRFDRVRVVAQKVKKFPELEKFLNQKPVIVAGSTWESDEQLLANYYFKNSETIKLIIAPHEIEKPHIAKLQELFAGKTVLYSELNQRNISCCNILIIDCIGMLMHLYQYGTIAYIGGGFGAGIHNILEAATFGLPVVFGRKYHKFNEAVDLIAAQGAFSIENAHQLQQTFDKLLSDTHFRNQTAAICKHFVETQIGATDGILRNIEE